MKIFTQALLIFVCWFTFLIPEAFTKTPNPYKVLGVKKDATDD